MIILDTNVLQGLKKLDGTTMRLLQGLAKVTGYELALPEIVVEEFLSHRTRNRLDKARELERAARTLQEVLPGWWEEEDSSRVTTDAIRSLQVSSTVRSPHRIIEQTRAAEECRLHEVFTILKSPRGAAEEALKREVWRIAPARTDDNAKRKGTGARDALVWLTALDVLNSQDADVILVSSDRAFGDQALKSELAEVATEKSGRLRLCRDAAELLEEMGAEATAPAGIADLAASSTSFENAIRARLAQTQHEVTVSIAPFVRRRHQLVPAFPIATSCVEVRAGKARQVGPDVWTLIDISVRVEHEGLLRRLDSGEIESDLTFSCTYDIDVTAVIGTNEGMIVGVEFVAVGTWRDPRNATVDGKPLRFEARGGIEDVREDFFFPVYDDSIKVPNRAWRPRGSR